MRPMNPPEPSLEQQLTLRVIEVLELDLHPDKIGEDQPIFGPDGLGLDSIDALEVVAMLQLDYDVEIVDAAQATRVLASIRAMADTIRGSR